ncbi:MAG: PAS domain S-box protein [Ignavibacteriae bacterium]|nr:PAS domain S-box protein [Ignavibacteriota bacterium]
MLQQKILVVEDEPIVAQDLARILTKLGFSIIGPCSTASEAIELVLSEKPDAALIDIHLFGDQDGVDAALKINELNPLPIIFITAFVDSETIKRAALAYPYGYIVKPFDDNQIHIALEIALHKFELDNHLRKNEERFRKLVSNSSDITTILNTSGDFMYMSASCELILGYSTEELTGKNIFDFIHKEDLEEIQGFFSEALVTKHSKVIAPPYRFYHSNGSWIYLESIGANLSEDSLIQGIIINSRDITDRRNTEEKLNSYLDQVVSSKNILQQTTSELFGVNKKLLKIEAELREEIMSKDKFFAIISHDLRSPFGNVLKLSEFLIKNINTLTTNEIHEIAGDIHESGRTVFNLLENLLQWAKIESGKMIANPSLIKLEQMTGHIEELFRGIAEAKGVELQVDISDDIMIYADNNMLFSAVQNLVSNAIKFTDRGGRVSLSAESENGKTTIKIKDTGIGMTTEEQAKLFLRAYHFTQTGTAGEQGAGLGLILSKELIEKNNGTIRVESTKNEGTTFIIELPNTIPQSIDMDSLQ